MTKHHDIIIDIHPKSLLLYSNTLVQTFDNKYDLIEYLRRNQINEYDLTTFFKNINEYKVDKTTVEQIRNQVKNNLIKRGIITGTIYEGYKYNYDGNIIDYAELATGNPKCKLEPIKKYDKYFYELYINMSIPYIISEEKIQEGAIRLAETIKALEELHIEIKVNIVLYSDGMFENDDNYLFICPLLSHLEYKDYQVLLPYTDGEFLRKALFTIMRNNGNTKKNLGRATKLKNTVNLWELKSDSEVELATRVLRDLGLQ